jgi:hypothetical protein
MIVFNLTCGNDHPFEGWFGSTADFEQQQQSKLLSCPVCGSDRVSKAIHAPYVNTGNSPKPPERAGKDGAERERAAKDGAEQYANVGDDLAQLIEHLIANTEDVGDSFPEEARRIHYNETPARKIRGQASHDEVKEMREEGIEVMALPVPKYRLGKTH